MKKAREEKAGGKNNDREKDKCDDYENMINERERK